jgi:hypothetical protein
LAKAILGSGAEGHRLGAEDLDLLRVHLHGRRR